MNAFDLLEALTDVDDDQLLQADLPIRRPRRLWHGLAAACLALALLATVFLGTTAFQQDTTMRYTVRCRENRVTYLCKVSAHRTGPMPRYDPSVLPEGYVYDRESSWENELTLSYRNKTAYMTLTCRRITGPYTLDLYTLPMGSYERYDITVGDLPGQLYLYTDPRTGGELLWQDVENGLLFHLRFEEDPEDALAVARSVKRCM